MLSHSLEARRFVAAMNFLAIYLVLSGNLSGFIWFMNSEFRDIEKVTGFIWFELVFIVFTKEELPW